MGQLRSSSPRFLPVLACVAFAVLVATPAAADELPGVSLSTSRSNQGWSLVFHLADDTVVSKILYRFDDQPDWRDTHENPIVDPRTGRRMPNSWVTLPDAWITPGAHRFAVKLVLADGNERGPFSFPIDFEAEVLTWAKHYVSLFDNQWVSFWDQENRKGSALLFTSLMSYKDSLSEIRYSLDDCEVGQRFPLRPWKDLTRPPGIAGDEDPLIRIPYTVKFACVQLVWRDGTKTEIQRYEHASARGDDGGGRP